MTPETLPEVRDYDDIEAEVKAFEEAERRRLNLNDEPIAHWVDPNPQRFTRAERGHTTILFGGLTIAHDQMVSAALTGLGHKVQPLDVADTEALRFGKEFGNRGQCNPTYFTVGNLVKYLVHLRDREKMPVDEIVRSHLFFTAGACGPCRFGTYVTEYRKALRDAGFDGFRVMLFQQQGGLRQATGEDAGLELSPKFFITLLKALLAGKKSFGLNARFGLRIVHAKTDACQRTGRSPDDRRAGVARGPQESTSTACSRNRRWRSSANSG